MTRKSFQFSTWAIVVFLVVNFALAFVTNVSVEPTSSDVAVFTTALGLRKNTNQLSYEEEIKLIKSMQRIVLEGSPGKQAIPEYSSREPEDLFLNKSGLCYDRSRTLDKILRWQGFETRHVYLLSAIDKTSNQAIPLWKAISTRKTDSHAVTEVKTSRGWVLVDSLEPWVSIDADGNPVDAGSIYTGHDRFSYAPEFYNQPYWAIRGMYSRRGHFYRPYIPYPELNWFDFASWLANG